MKYISKKSSAGILIVIALVAGGWFWYVSTKERQAREDKSVTQSQDSGTSSVGRNTTEKEIIWYDIPELGIRFPVDQETKDELVYYVVLLSGKSKNGEGGKTNLVTFSTKKLESLSKYCSAESGPLGAISRRVGAPLDLNAPCGGGQKVKEFDGGYFCYTHSQSVCTDTREQYDQYMKASAEKYDKLFTSEDFWKTVIIK